MEQLSCLKILQKLHNKLHSLQHLVRLPRALLQGRIYSFTMKVTLNLLSCQNNIAKRINIKKEQVYFKQKKRK